MGASVSLFLAQYARYRPCRYHGRNGMLIDKLRGFARAFQYHGKRVETAHYSFELHSAHQVNGDRNAFFSGLIQEVVLQVH